jgi:hypothetical protein
VPFEFVVDGEIQRAVQDQFTMHVVLIPYAQDEIQAALAEFAETDIWARVF